LINKGVKLLALTLLLAAMAFMVWDMRDFGEPDGTYVMRDHESGTIYMYDRTAMDDHFLASSQGKDTSTNNVVTAIVFDFRGFDTLGEATVLFAAVTGVLVAIRKAFPKEGASPAKGGDGR